MNVPKEIEERLIEIRRHAVSAVKRKMPGFNYKEAERLICCCDITAMKIVDEFGNPWNLRAFKSSLIPEPTNRQKKEQYSPKTLVHVFAYNHVIDLCCDLTASQFKVYPYKKIVCLPFVEYSKMMRFKEEVFISEDHLATPDEYRYFWADIS